MMRCQVQNGLLSSLSLSLFLEEDGMERNDDLGKLGGIFF